MKNFKNKVIAITGAASGIGRALAHQFAQEGAKLALSDRNEDALQTVRQECLDFGALDVMCTVVDVSSKDQIEAWAAEVDEKFSEIHVIINNAGISLGASIESMEYEDFEKVMDVNFWGVVYGSKAFLPFIKKSGEGHVVNISSLYGLMSMPNQAAYNSAKFAVRAFSECLRMELALEKSPIKTNCVCPGGIKTNIVNNGVFKQQVGMIRDRQKEDIADMFNKLARTTAEEAAQIIIKGVKRNKRRIMVGADATALSFALRILPVSYQKIIERFLK